MPVFANVLVILSTLRSHTLRIVLFDLHFENAGLCIYYSEKSPQHPPSPNLNYERIVCDQAKEIPNKNAFQ